jgi:hypothetical protein
LLDIYSYVEKVVLLQVQHMSPACSCTDDRCTQGTCMDAESGANWCITVGATYTVLFPTAIAGLEQPACFRCWLCCCCQVSSQPHPLHSAAPGSALCPQWYSGPWHHPDPLPAAAAATVPATARFPVSPTPFTVLSLALPCTPSGTVAPGTTLTHCLLLLLLLLCCCCCCCCCCCDCQVPS